MNDQLLKHQLTPFALHTLFLLSLGTLHAADAGPVPAAASAPFTAKGDRHPAVNLVYPEAAFLHAGKGGRLVDVTKPPFNAKGGGMSPAFPSRQNAPLKTSRATFTEECRHE